jgi:hypothetical protein
MVRAVRDQHDRRRRADREERADAAGQGDPQAPAAAAWRRFRWGTGWR